MRHRLYINIVRTFESEMLESLFYSVYSVLAVKILGPIQLHLDYRKSKIHLRVRRTGRSCEGQWQTTLEGYKEPQDFEIEERPSQNPRISNLLSVRVRFYGELLG